MLSLDLTAAVHGTSPETRYASLGMADPEFIAALNWLADDIHMTTRAKKFHEPPKTLPHLAGMVMTELSEAIEADRRVLVDESGNVNVPIPMSEKLPGFSLVEEEIADAIIRLLDYAGQQKLRIGEAIVEKVYYNETRPSRHGRRY